MIGSDILTEGLSLPDNVAQQNLTNWKNMSEYMSKAEPKLLKSADYTETDYLLYAITTASYDRRVISVDWLKNIKDRLVTEYENVNPDSGNTPFTILWLIIFVWVTSITLSLMMSFALQQTAQL